MLRFWFLILAISLISPAANADYYAGGPRDIEVFSQDRGYVAHVIAPLDDGGTAIEVSSLSEGKKSLIWRVDAGDIQPKQVFVSDDGEAVVTFDNGWGVGNGDNVLAIYRDTGLIRSYSLESMFGFRTNTHIFEELEALDRSEDSYDKVNQLHRELDRIRRRIPHSTSSRWWRNHVFSLFDEEDAAFALWVDWHARWVAWDIRTGEPLSVSDEQCERWDQVCRDRILDDAKARKGALSVSSCLFLGKIQNNEDKPRIEAMLSSDGFQFWSSTGRHASECTFEATSPGRAVADAVLAHWGDGGDRSGLRESWSVDRRHGYALLGVVAVEVRLPQRIEKGPGYLVVRLNDVRGEVVLENRPAHVLCADLRTAFPSLGPIDEDFVPRIGPEFRFVINGVQPGAYEVVVCWNKEEPYTSRANGFPTTPGDWVARDAVRFTVKAGEVVENLVIKDFHEAE